MTRLKILDKYIIFMSKAHEYGVMCKLANVTPTGQHYVHYASRRRLAFNNHFTADSRSFNSPDRKAEMTLQRRYIANYMNLPKVRGGFPSLGFTFLLTVSHRNQNQPFSA